MPLPLISSTALRERRFALDHAGCRRRVRMTSLTCVSSRRPSDPPGCDRAKSSTEKPRASSSVSASASPSARAAVVLAVGASPSGQASASTLASRWTSAACASDECSLPVSAINRAPWRLRCGSSETSSSVSPGIRQQQHDVVARDHAEVAVARLGGVHEERRRAGRRQRRGELARDVAGFADAGHDDAAAAVEAARAPRRGTARRGARAARAIASASVASTSRPERERALRVETARGRRGPPRSLRTCSQSIARTLAGAGPTLCYIGPTRSHAARIATDLVSARRRGRGR